MPAATLYPHTELIEGIAGPWTLEGGDLVGDLIGGFGIRNANVPIFVGGTWIRRFGPRGVPGVPQGPFLDRFLFVVEPVHLVLPYSALRGFSFAIGASLSDYHRSTGTRLQGQRSSLCQSHTFSHYLTFREVIRKEFRTLQNYHSSRKGFLYPSTSEPSPHHTPCLPPLST